MADHGIELAAGAGVGMEVAADPDGGGTVLTLASSAHGAKIAKLITAFVKKKNPDVKVHLEGRLQLLVHGGLGSQGAAQAVDRETRDRADRRVAAKQRREELGASDPVSGDSAHGGDDCRHVIP